MYEPLGKKELSERLRRALDALEKFTESVGAVSDELMEQYLVEIGELDPDDLEDFLTTKKYLAPLPEKEAKKKKMRGD